MNNLTNHTHEDEIGGLLYILKYASIYIPYTTLTIIGFIMGLCGNLSLKF